jgi:NAD(P)H-hydrate epimerase
MQQLDSLAINKYSLPGIVLMENAGRAFADVLEKHVFSFEGKSILIVCGKGNNGGDGFVIARHLVNRGARVHVILLSKRNDVKGDAKANLIILLKMIASKKSSLTFEEVLSAKKLSRLSLSPLLLAEGLVDDSTRRGVMSVLSNEKHEAKVQTIIIDAIFGTGFKGEVKGLYYDAVRWINQQHAFVASVDIPSGVNATTGVVENIAVAANLTVTMGLSKIGHYVGEGREHAGEVVPVDISIPDFLLEVGKKPTYRISAQDVKAALPVRPATAHKYSVGTVLLIAGSRNFTGAPVMSAVSAMKAGAGAVILAVPKSIHAALVKKATEVMLLPLDETDEGTIALKAANDIMKKLPWADVVALGPGLAQNLETRELVHKLVREIYKPLVLDADGLGMMAYDISLLKKRRFETIITPHVGELRLLTQLDRDFIELNRVEVARVQARKLNSVLVLKGSPTVTGTPDGKAFLNSTGNPGMATAGSGDVLTGIIASFLAQGMLSEEAAYAGALVHGLAGDIGAKKFGERSLMALDILDCIPEALMRIERTM